GGGLARHGADRAPGWQRHARQPHRGLSARPQPALAIDQVDRAALHPDCGSQRRPAAARHTEGERQRMKTALMRLRLVGASCLLLSACAAMAPATDAMRPAPHGFATAAARGLDIAVGVYGL